MSSATTYTTAQSTVDRHPGTLTTTSEAEGDHPLSSPERMPKLGDITNPTIVKRQLNSGPMDWESWPTGRPGPYVCEAQMQRVMHEFQQLNGRRNEQSRTKEHVIHMAEFSSSGRGESEVYRSSPDQLSLQKYLLDTSRSRSWLLGWK